MKNPIDAIISNCRIFLDNKNRNTAILDHLIVKSASEMDIKIAQSNVSNMDVFGITKVLSVALAKKDIIEMLISCKDPSYNAIDDSVYKMACRNLANQIRQDSELKQKIRHLRSNKKIKELENEILGLDAFDMSQVISIAFLKESKQVVFDIIEEQSNLTETY